MPRRPPQRSPLHAPLAFCAAAALAALFGCGDGEKPPLPVEKPAPPPTPPPARTLMPDAELLYTTGLEARDPDRFVANVKRAAELGLRKANHRLGLYYYRGEFNQLRDFNEAAHWFQAGAEKGDPLAMQAIGWACHTGLGVPQDDAQAEQWLRKAVAGGSESAAGALDIVCKGHWTVYRTDGSEHTTWDKPAGSEGIWRLTRIEPKYAGNADFIYFKPDGWPQPEKMPVRPEPSYVVYYWTGKDWRTREELPPATHRRLLEAATPEHLEAAAVYNKGFAPMRALRARMMLAHFRRQAQKPGLTEHDRTQAESQARFQERLLKDYEEHPEKAPGGSRYKEEPPEDLSKALSFRLLALETRNGLDKVYGDRAKAYEKAAKLKREGDPQKELPDLEASCEEGEAYLKLQEDLLRTLEAHIK